MAGLTETIVTTGGGVVVSVLAFDARPVQVIYRGLGVAVAFSADDAAKLARELLHYLDNGGFPKARSR